MIEFYRFIKYALLAVTFFQQQEKEKRSLKKDWKFWGIYVHVCKMETLKEVYKLTKQNKGSPGVDGVTFEQIEAEGVDKMLEKAKSITNTNRYTHIEYLR